MTKGQFKEQEVLVLRTAICDYAKENNLTSKELEDLLNESSQDKTYSKAWVEISKSLRKFIHP